MYWGLRTPIMDIITHVAVLELVKYTYYHSWYLGSMSPEEKKKESRLGVLQSLGFSQVPDSRQILSVQIPSAGCIIDIEIPRKF